jgi:diaminopimelate epimerase
MNQPIAFHKMQGVGNDFVVVDGRDQPEMDWSAFALAACDRRFGIGADGLLVIQNSDNADFRMAMFNPDGSPDVCGNGLRCVARYAWERGLINKTEFHIETLIDVRPAQINLDAADQFQSVTIGMNFPQFAPDAVPIRADADAPLLDFPLALPDGTTLRISPLSTGSTHSVTFVDELPDDETFFRISPLVENSAHFPDRTSLMWCKVETPTRLRLRIWERGVGETWGCGTGACAAMVAAKLHNRVAADAPISVVSRGGELLIQWSEGEPIQMTGPAEFVFEGGFSYCPANE